ncbi:hypothetical protein Tco_0041140 [Tanacetum coccineum]
MPVAKSSASKKPERQIPTGHRFSNKKTTTVPEKTMTPRLCLSWKLTGRIFKTIGLRWVPTGKIFAFSTNKVNSEPAHGSIVDIPHIYACKQTLGLSAGTSFNGQQQQRIDITADALYNEKQENLRVWLLKFLISKKPVPECSGLVLHQMTSDHNRSELGILVHSNEQVKFKVVPKVVLKQTRTVFTKSVGITIPLHIAMLRDNSHVRKPKDALFVAVQPSDQKNHVRTRLSISFSGWYPSACSLELSCLLKEQLLEPALNLTVHCCGLEFRVLKLVYQKSFVEERGSNVGNRRHLTLTTEA